MENFLYLHFSNRIEQLYQVFKECLFTSSHPLTKRVVIVPSAAMRSWLMLQMAEDPALGIFAGMEIRLLEPTIDHLVDILSIQTTKSVHVSEPSEWELALALEETMVKAAVDFHSSAGSLHHKWLPLIQYLGICRDHEKKISRRISKRIRELASVLGNLFCEYGLYGGQMIAEWGENPSSWQFLLWQQMEFVFGEWNYPIKKLKSFEINPLLCSNDIQVHLFGLSFLAPLHQKFFKKIAARLPVCYYLISPCQKFWGDTLSDKESMQLENYWTKQGAKTSSLEALEIFLRDRNPLLANFGRLGREMSMQIESMDGHSTEIYALPKSIFQEPSYSELISDEVLQEEIKSPLTLLEAVQADIALLRTPEVQNQILFKGYDQTIQVHAAPKKSREIQVIYDALISIIDRHSVGACPILARDIVVMAPNIKEYAPFIRCVFESPESQLEMQLMDVEGPSHYLLIQEFLHLLSLNSGRWEASALLQLFDYTSFCARHRLTREDVSVIQQWVKEAVICWGKDPQHRREIFERDYPFKEPYEEAVIGTWEYGLGRLLERLVIFNRLPSENGPTTFRPLNCIEASQGDLLGVFIHLIRSIAVDLQPLIDGTLLSLEDWSIYLTCLLEAYFLPCTEEDMEGEKILKELINRFEKASKKLPQSKYSFETISGHLLALLKAEKTNYKESNLNAVRFSSLLSMRAVPAKVIVLMGLGEGLFPRMEQINSLNLLLEDLKADYYPTTADCDRYNFLESILSARQYFIMSYVCQEPGNSQAQAPSLLVKELISYLDHSYRINHNQILEKPSKFCLYNHPLIPFHESYFSDTSVFKSYSRNNYLAALSYYGLEKRAKDAFLPEFVEAIHDQEDFQDSTTIDIKDLLAYSKNPLKVYLNKTLGIYLNKEQDRAIRDEEDLFLSDLNASILSRQGLFGSESLLLDEAEKSGQLPQGSFKVIGKERIKREIDQYSENLKTLAISLNEIFSIEFTEKSLAPQFFEGVWKVPAIILHVPKIGAVKIKGRLDNICKKGLILFSKQEAKKILEIWPACLILCWLIEEYDLEIASQVIFVKGDKVKTAEMNPNGKQISAIKSLETYLEYYMKAKIRPSPLSPKLIPSILSGEADELKEAFKENVDDEFQPQSDQYLMWLARNSPNAELESTLDYWQATAQNLFAVFFEKTSPRKPSDSIQDSIYDIV